MSELRTFDSERIYWAVERVEREAGDIDTLHLDDTLFYIKSEADKVIANKGTENRRLKRALWIARASEAAKEVNYWTCQDESSYAIVDFNVRHETIVSYNAPHHRPYKWILIWENVERKCRAKAGELK